MPLYRRLHARAEILKNNQEETIFEILTKSVLVFQFLKTRKKWFFHRYPDLDKANLTAKFLFSHFFFSELVRN